MSVSDTTLVIKNPSRSNQHFSLSFRLDGTIADLQQLLSETYDGRPAPADQTLIYGGKVLKDPSVRLRDIVSKHDAPEGPHSIHLVIKVKSSNLSASPARSVDGSTTSSLSVSRTSSNLNPNSSIASRLPQPSIRTAPTTYLTAATPSTSTTPSIPSHRSEPEPSTAAPHSEPEDPAATYSYWNAWAGLPGPLTTPYSVPFGSLPPLRPPADSTQPSSQEPAGAAAAAAAAAYNAANSPYYSYYNPVIGCAYQAAYSAALSALSNMPPQPSALQPQTLEQQPVAGGGAFVRQGVEGVQGGSAAGEANGAAAGGLAAGREEASGSTTAAAVVMPTESSAVAGGVTAAGCVAAAGGVPYAYVPMFVPTYGGQLGGYPYGFPSSAYPFPPPPATTATAVPGGRRASGATPSTPGWLYPQNPWGPPLPHLDGANPFLGPDGLVDMTALLEALGGGGGGGAGGGGASGRRQGEGRETDAAGAAAGGLGGAGGREGGQQGGVLRQRRNRILVAGPVAVAVGNNDQQARHRVVAALAGAGARRPRVFTIRITTRLLLQALVFAVVLYQHFTWGRIIALLVGAAVLFITSRWAPLRSLLRGINAMPARGGAMAGAGGAPAAAAAGEAAGAAAAGPGAGAGQQAVRRRGILHEILVFVVGFITSLLPAWNINPEDAAAFAAAQEMLAAEERMRQQQAAAAREGADAAEAEGGEARAAPDAGNGPEALPLAAEGMAAN